MYAMLLLTNAVYENKFYICQSCIVRQVHVGIKNGLLN